MLPPKLRTRQASPSCSGHHRSTQGRPRPTATQYLLPMAANVKVCGERRRGLILDLSGEQSPSRSNLWGEACPRTYEHLPASARPRFGASAYYCILRLHAAGQAIEGEGTVSVRGERRNQVGGIRVLRQLGSGRGRE
jgi:hypothetical protein